MKSQLKPLAVAVLATFALSAQALDFSTGLTNQSVTGDPNIQIGTAQSPVNVGFTGSGLGNEFNLTTGENGLISMAVNQTGILMTGATLTVGSEQTASVNIQAQNEASGVRGIWSSNSPTATTNIFAQNITVSASSANGFAQGVMNSLGKVIIGSENTDQLGISAQTNSTISAAVGVSSAGAGATTTLTADTMNISAESNSTNAIALSNTSDLLGVNGRDVTVNAHSNTGASTAISNSNGGAVQINADGEVNVSASAQSGSSYGITNLTQGRVSISGNEINVTSENGRGIQNASGSTLNLQGQNIIVRGSELAVLNVGANLTVGSQNSQVVRLSATGENSRGMEVNSLGSATISGQHVEISGQDIGLYALNGAVEVNAGQLIIAAGENGQGLIAQSNDEQMTNPAQRGTIEIHADSTVIDASQGAGAGITATSYGLVDISGDLTVNAQDAIYTRGNSTINVNTGGNSTVVLNGNIAFASPGPAENSGEILDSEVNINLTGAGSSWTGNVYKAYSKDISVENRYVTGLSVTLANDAQWNPTIITAQSDDTGVSEGQALNNLHFDGGVINLTHGSDQVVTIENTTGSGGTVNLLTTENEDGVLQTGTVNFGTVKGAPNLLVNYTGITADDLKGRSLSEIDGGVEANGATRTEHVGQGAILGAVTETYDAQGEMTSRTVAENTRLNAYGSVAALSIMQWRHEMSDLTKRMGELRMSPEGVGSWARIYGSEQEYGSQNITARNNSVQVGVDADVGYGWKVGAAFSYTDGKADYDLGNADNKSYGLGVYGTWMAENGQYVDLTAKYNRLDTDFELEGMDGSSDNNAFSVSAEYGWHLKLGQAGFVEPQAQVTYGYIQGDKFHTSNGVEIDQDNFESLIGRVGVRTGFHLPNDKGVIYARVSGLHDFKGDFDSTATLMSDRTLYDHVSEDLGDTWVEFGVGANFNWTDTTYSYVDLERSNGGDVKENWRWNVGIRHVF